MKQLKSWFFSTIRGLNPRGKFINLADFGEPDQITFTDLLDTTLTKKIDSSNFQDQADFNNINAQLDGDKFVNPSGLPEMQLGFGSILNLSIIPATSLTPRRLFVIDAPLSGDPEMSARVSTTFTTPANMPTVEADPAPGNLATVTSSTTGGFTTYLVYTGSATGDLRYLKLDGTNSPMSGNVNWGGKEITNITRLSRGTASLNFGTDSIDLFTSTTQISQASFGMLFQTANNSFSMNEGGGGGILMYGQATGNVQIFSDNDIVLKTFTSQAIKISTSANEASLKTDLLTGPAIYQFPATGGTLLVSTDLKLSALQSAVATNTINNGNFGQIWRWSLTSNPNTGLHITESAPSTNGVGSQYMFRVTTQASSTAAPMLITARGASALTVFPDGSVYLAQNSTSVQIQGRLFLERGIEVLLFLESTASGVLNDYDVSQSIHYVFTGAVTSITGFTRSASFSKIIIITNGSAGTITLVEESASSLAVNRIRTPAGKTNINLVADDTIMLIYDYNLQRWRTISTGTY